ncbi:MAG: sialate O-acetylesterase [Arcticibacterium sp.]|jgi:sialate O-acetylesterase
MKKVYPLILLFLLPFLVSAQLKVANIFGDYMVLQRNKPIKVWGWNTPNENVIVVFNGQSYATITSDTGKWVITLDAVSADGMALQMEVRDNDEQVTFLDILMGEVWLCSGQSNMEWQLNNTNDAAKEIIEAENYPLIRHIAIPKATSLSPKDEFEDKEWEVCSSKTAGDFTAVGYFFARKLLKEMNVPIGLVHSSWSGSHIETWISKDAMLASTILKDYAQKMPKNSEESNKSMERNTIKRFHGSPDFDINKLKETDYLEENYDFSSWISIDPHGTWDWKGVPSFRGTMYLQRELELTEKEADQKTEMNFGYTTGDIAFYVNGKLIHQGYHDRAISFKIPQETWITGRNRVLVKFSANRNSMDALGLGGAKSDYNLNVGGLSKPLFDIEWKARPSWDSPRFYEQRMNNEGTLCYNAMIHPFVGLGMQGAIWYQGESNASRAHQYRTSFPLLINDWRQKWNSGFPFLWVQLSSFGAFNDSNTGSNWAELREAQSLTLSLPKTGEAVTIDIGNAYNVHPTNKQDVGLRLGLSALKVAYGKALVHSGPTYRSMSVKKGKAILSFDNFGTGLKSINKYRNLEGFEIAGADQEFYFAKSEIVGDKIMVSHPMVKLPKSVRYGWSNSPVDANLFNKENLPASPFRTDSWKGITEGVSFK